MRASYDDIVDGLAERGYAVVPDFVGEQLLRDLAASARAAFSEERFAEASVGKGDSRRRDETVRGDLTLWIDPAGVAAGAPEARWLAAMEALRSAVNRELSLGAFTLESHYALYPPGTRYARHSDRHVGTDARVLTSVLYLNEAWAHEDGGALRIYLDDGSSLDVPPFLGTNVFFLPDRFEHEVLPGRRERWSLTAWFRRRG